jgi:hypothetical protein
MLDLSSRMQDISLALNEPETTTADPSNTTTTTTATTPLEDKERMLDELMEIVESIDQAKDLSTVGGLPTLLNLLSSPHESLRWRAAEVIATCVQNNPEVQDAFLQGGALPALWPLLEINSYTNINEAAATAATSSTTSFSAVCLIKGMLAVSCQIRGHPASLQWFQEHEGLKKIIEILVQVSKNGSGGSSGGGSDGDGSLTIDEGDVVRVQRKCLQMLEYILRTSPNDRKTAVSINIGEENTTNTSSAGSLLPVLVRLLADADDVDIRSAALGVLHQLSGDDTCLLELQKESLGVVSAVQAVQCKLDSLPKEEWGPAEEEAKLAVAVMTELVRKVESNSGSENIVRSDEEAERSGSMQLMALPQDQE